MIRTEACAIILLYNSYNISNLTIHRAPTGNFTYIIKKLEAILCSLYNLNTQCFRYGVTRANYLVHNSRKDALLSSFNSSSTVYFLTNKSATAVDSIFIDISKFPNYVVSPLYNDLSDHDAQLINLSDIDIKIQNPKFKIIRRIDKYSVLYFCDIS